MNLAAMCVIVLGIVIENQTSLQYAQVPRYLVTVYDLTRLKPTSSSFLVGIRSIQSRARCPRTQRGFSTETVDVAIQTSAYRLRTSSA